MTASPARRSRLIRNLRPDLRSLRGRYILVAAAFIAFLLVMAVAGDRVIRDAARTHFEEMRQGSRVANLVRWALLASSELKNAVQRVTILPRPGAREMVAPHQAALHAAADALRRALEVHTIAAAAADLERLEREITDLDQDIELFMATRADVRHWFPTMNLMLDEMLPAHTAFLTDVELALEETATGRDPARLALYRQLVALRHSWVQMISEFRLLVANRFGVFTGDTRAGIEARRRNIDLYGGTVDGLLAALQADGKAGRLGFVTGQVLPDLLAQRGRWQRAYRQALATLRSERWRTDLEILLARLEPRFAAVNAVLHDIQTALEVRARSHAARLSQGARRLAGGLWLAALAGVLFTLAGLWIFQRTVLTPIRQVARALREEARGGEPRLPPLRHTTETRELAEAFQEMRAQVSLRQQRLEEILDHAAEGIITIDEQGVIQSFNNAAQWLFGYSDEEIIGQPVTVLLPPAERGRLIAYAKNMLAGPAPTGLGEERELTALHRDGSVVHVSVKVSQTRVEGKRLFTALVADISERKAMMDHLRHLAEHDGLTGLYNRTFFQNELERVVARARHRQGQPASLLYIDMDNFKYVNDTLGHAAGDRLLVEVAGILHRRARRGDLIARFGGDEFVVLLYDTEADVAVKVADAFRRQLADYVFVEGTERVDAGCSIGVTVITAETESATDALSQVDFACHLAKRAGRNQVYLFDQSDRKKMDTLSLDMGWSLRIKAAIEQDRFALVCQPIIAVDSGAICAYEVLIRMLDEDNSYIMPAGFLPSAERFGLSADIDKWVIVHAIETLAAQRETLPDLRYHINLSAKTLAEPAVCDLIAAELERHGLEAAALTFEITETVAIADRVAARAFLARLQALGCRTALDDFGAGFTSFAYLRDLPVDQVKIDGQYIRHLVENEVDQAMVRAMNEIVHVMGMETVAEFVESAEILALLREYGVDYAQGHHIAQPDRITACAAIAENAGLGLACRAP